jgi:hypothetical protein
MSTSLSVVVAVQALSAATGVRDAHPARPSLDTKAFSHSEPFSTSHPFRQPRLITQPEVPVVSQGSYGATVHAPSPSRLHRYDRARVQKQLDFDSNGNWTTQKSMRPGQSAGLVQLAFMPFEGARRWNSTREAAGFSGLHLLLVGSSPISQLAIDFPRLHGGAFDEYQCPFRGGSAFCNYPTTDSACSGAGFNTFKCAVLSCNKTTGCGCHDCVCCCGCKALSGCSGSDFVFNNFLTRTKLTFSWKPELLNSEADLNAFVHRFSCRFCPEPPDVVILSKGIHEAYFFQHVYADPALRAKVWKLGRRWPRNDSLPIITPSDHAERMERALRRYVPILRCLPNSTLIIWLTPYHSFKAPWEAELVAASREMMLRVHREGGLEKGHLLDTWQMSHASGAPRTADGNHRTSHFQTVIWSLVAHALETWRTPRDDTM